MLKLCSHVAGKRLLPPAALERSDSAWPHVAGESCPGGFEAFAEFWILSLSWVVFTFLQVMLTAWAEIRWEGSCLSCACGDARFARAGLRCSNLVDKLCCQQGVGMRCWSCSCTLSYPGKGNSCPWGAAGAPGMLFSIPFWAACVSAVAEAGMRG